MTEKLLKFCRHQITVIQEMVKAMCPLAYDHHGYIIRYYHHGTSCDRMQELPLRHNGDSSIQ